ncbi:RTA1-like protein [Irpex rosettiformis]|uniref:RTA1-like protein n=1 Tax=Irpex rosettiformis TaxID=378272 RepID=A0ACB8UES7_9APHY|nr:RTA1-like protein [Irpex rosettiformis]
MSSNTTSSTDINSLSPYNYVPTEWVTITFLALFGVSAGQAIWFKLWFLIPTAVLAGIGETIGWAGRFWSTQNILNNNAYLMQITTTIISPTPLLAANFIIFSRLVSLLGTQYSRLSPVWYSRIFLTCDIVALVIQAAGGGIASSSNDLSVEKTGSNIMLAGIVFQLVALSVFSFLMAEYVIRFLNNRPLHSATLDSSSSSASTLVRGRVWNMKQKLAMTGLVFSTLVLFIRGVYRTIELADGWNGRIISTQVYFNVLDGAMVVLAMYTWNILHPGLLLVDNSKDIISEDKYNDGTKGVMMRRSDV